MPQTFTRNGSSGLPVHKKFCGKCGTSLCSDFTAGAFYPLAASILDQKNSFSPRMAIYTASAPDWAVYPDRVPKFDTFPDSSWGRRGAGRTGKRLRTRDDPEQMLSTLFAGDPMQPFKTSVLSDRAK